MDVPKMYPEDPQESFLECYECSLEAIARDVVKNLFEARRNAFDVDEVLNMLEIYWQNARDIHQVPDVDLYDAFDRDVLEHLVAHSVYHARCMN